MRSWCNLKQQSGRKPEEAGWVFDMKAFKNIDNPQEAADTASRLIRSKIRTGRVPNSSLGKQGCPFPLFELKVVNPDYKDRLSKVAAWKTTAKIVDPNRCSRCGEKLPDTLHANHEPACEACGLDAAIAIDEAEAPQSFCKLIFREKCEV